MWDNDFVITIFIIICVLLIGAVGYKIGSESVEEKYALRRTLCKQIITK